MYLQLDVRVTLLVLALEVIAPAMVVLVIQHAPAQEDTVLAMDVHVIQPVLVQEVIGVVLIVAAIRLVVVILLVMIALLIMVNIC